MLLDLAKKEVDMNLCLIDLFLPQVFVKVASIHILLDFHEVKLVIRFAFSVVSTFKTNLAKVFVDLFDFVQISNAD